MKTFRLHNRRLRRQSLLLYALVLVALSLLTSWYFNSTLSIEYQQKKLQRYISEQVADAQQVLNDTALMRRLVNRLETKEEFDRLAAKQWGLFLFAETLTDQDLLFWNSQRIVHPPVTFDSSYGTRFEKLGESYYVTQKKLVVLPGMSNHKLAYVMIPVVTGYYLETETLRTGFAHDPYAVQKIKIAASPTAFPIRSAEGKTLFYVQAAEAETYVVTDAVTMVFRLTALLLLLLALYLHAVSLVRKKNAVTGAVFLFCSFAVVRFLLHLFPSLALLRQLQLFDPTIYASGLNSSLGALLLNAILLCWIVLFAWDHLAPLKTLPRFLKGRGILVAGAAAVFLLMMVTFQLALLVNRMVADSKISFEVTDYSKLSVYTAISFLILALFSLSYYYFSRLLFRFILLAFPNLLQLYFTVALTGLVFLTVISSTGKHSHKEVLFYLPVLAWLVAFTLLLSKEQSIINRFRITIAGLLFWVFVFSVSLAALIMQGNREREIRDQKQVASKLDQQTDPTKTKVLAIPLVYLNNQFLLNNFHRFRHHTESRQLHDSITGISLLDNSKAYSVNMYVFDSSAQPIMVSNNVSYEQLNNVYQTHLRRDRKSQSGAKDLVYYETSPTQFVYLIRRTVLDSSRLVGTVFLVATPLKFEGVQKLNPDIFSTTERPPDNPSLLTAVYIDNRLHYFTGNYAFLQQLPPGLLPGNEYHLRESGNYEEVWYQPGNNRVILVAQKKDTFIESITLFSYLFCAFLFMVGFIRLSGIVGRLARTWPRIDIFSRLSIRSQIHVTIIFISVLSFVVIGIATIGFFVQRNNSNNTEDLYRTAHSTLNELEKQAAEDSLLFNDRNSFADTVNLAALAKVVNDISEVHNRVVNIFDTNGVLKITSREDIYGRGILSRKMDPVAFYHMTKAGQVQRLQDEYLANFDYQSIYLAIRDSSQRPFAYLNIPYFESRGQLDQEISNFLVTVINLNAFIVLIAGVIALFITNRITRSFSVIGDKMKEITLGRTNEEIEWNKDDEIGELVKQYNKMVHQLEESATALAKSEREGAWREMARQVAHEIKNPLTPMKLSIQYLQKAIQANQPNVKDLTSAVAGTLIEQIDHLSKIAADFSQFANIGHKRTEYIDLHSVVGSLLDLYAANPRVTLKWNPVPHEAIMQADKTHMNRLFTNLLTNAVDACPGEKRCSVTISERMVGRQLLISITDNGEGIPPEMHAKIFTPNFTTKTSGTGLGLAMCKGIVEQAGGDIWFETKVGEGTTFFVQLPLAVDGL